MTKANQKAQRLTKAAKKAWRTRRKNAAPYPFSRAAARS